MPESIQQILSQIGVALPGVNVPLEPGTPADESKFLGSGAVPAPGSIADSELKRLLAERDALNAAAGAVRPTNTKAPVGQRALLGLIDGINNTIAARHPLNTKLRGSDFVGQQRLLQRRSNEEETAAARRRAEAGLQQNREDIAAERGRLQMEDARNAASEESRLNREFSATQAELGRDFTSGENEEDRAARERMVRFQVKGSSDMAAAARSFQREMFNLERKDKLDASAAQQLAGVVGKFRAGRDAFLQNPDQIDPDQVRNDALAEIEAAFPDETNPSHVNGRAQAIARYMQIVEPELVKFETERDRAKSEIGAGEALIEAVGLGDPLRRFENFTGFNPVGAATNPLGTLLQMALGSGKPEDARP